MHEYTGNVQEYIKSPRNLGFRLREGSTAIDFQSWLLGLLTFTTTTISEPKLLSEFPECYTKSYEREEWNKCLDDLRNLSLEVRKDNEQKLKYPFRSFNPDYLECSISA